MSLTIIKEVITSSKRSIGLPDKMARWRGVALVVLLATALTLCVVRRDNKREMGVYV